MSLKTDIGHRLSAVVWFVIARGPAKQVAKQSAWLDRHAGPSRQVRGPEPVEGLRRARDDRADHTTTRLLRLFAPLLLALALDARADPQTADLGEGLRYIRLSDASEIASFEGVEVVDLRFTDALEESAENLAGHLRAAAQSGATLFVLVNSATDPLLRHSLARVQGSVKPLIFIGPATPELAPEIVTDPDPETERRACDAIAGGTPPADLIKEELVKRRFDEAALAHSRANGGDGHPDDGTAPKPEAEAKPAPLKDISLQRAVFLHRALIALGRINGAA